MTILLGEVIALSLLHRLTLAARIITTRPEYHLFTNNCQNFCKYLVEAVCPDSRLCPATIRDILSRPFLPIDRRIVEVSYLPGHYPATVSSSENHGLSTTSHVASPNFFPARRHFNSITETTSGTFITARTDLESQNGGGSFTAALTGHSGSRIETAFGSLWMTTADLSYEQRIPSVASILEENIDIYEQGTVCP